MFGHLLHLHGENIYLWSLRKSDLCFDEDEKVVYKRSYSFWKNDRMSDHGNENYYESVSCREIVDGGTSFYKRRSRSFYIGWRMVYNDYHT